MEPATGRVGRAAGDVIAGVESEQLAAHFLYPEEYCQANFVEKLAEIPCLSLLFGVALGSS